FRLRGSGRRHVIRSGPGRGGSAYGAGLETRYRSRTQLFPSGVEEVVAIAQTRDGLAAARTPQPAPVHSLFGQGLAGGGAPSRPHGIWTAIADMDRPRRRRPQVRGTLGGSDHIRRLEALGSWRSEAP